MHHHVCKKYKITALEVIDYLYDVLQTPAYEFIPIWMSDELRACANFAFVAKFNDEAAGFEPVRQLLLAAHELSQAELDAMRTPTRIAA